MLCLLNLDESREVELQVVHDDNGTIDYENGFSTYKVVLRSVSLLKTVATPFACRSVCSYRGKTYVSLDDYSIARIEENYHLTNSLVRFGYYNPHSYHYTYHNTNNQVEVDGIAVYNDRIYTLVYGNPCVVHVHDLEGNPILHWNHNEKVENFGYRNKLAIVADQLIVTDCNLRELVFYSLDGKKVRQIPCSQLASGITAMCVGGDNSVIISTNGNLVFKVRIVDGQVLWTTNVNQPVGIALYHKHYVCVVNKLESNQININLLDIKTGKLACR